MQRRRGSHGAAPDNICAEFLCQRQDCRGTASPVKEKEGQLCGDLLQLHNQHDSAHGLGGYAVQRYG